MISVSGGRRGFYSNILWYLAHCHAAEKLNDEIEFVEFSPHYCDDIKTGFYQFYEHVEKNPIKYKDDFYYVNNIENIRYFNNTEICGFILDFEMRKYLKFLIDKYLIIKPHILEKIKSFGDKKVLGVHIRLSVFNVDSYIASIYPYNFISIRFVKPNDLTIVRRNGEAKINVQSLFIRFSFSYVLL